MKKIKEKGLNRKIKKILNELNDVSELIICDVVVSNFNMILVAKYFDEIEDYEEGIRQIVEAILGEKSVANLIVMNLIKINDINIQNFLDLGIEDLKKEFDKSIVPAYHNTRGVSPDMVIFYYVSHDLPRDEKFNFAVKYDKEEFQKYKDFSETYKKVIEIKDLEDTLFEKSINEFYYGRAKIADGITEEEIIEDLCNRYKAEYINGKLLISPQILKFFDTEAHKIVEYQKYKAVSILKLFSLSQKAMKYLEKAMSQQTVDK